MRVGSTQSQEADVRIIAATNRDPMKAVADGKLREDLLYRLNVFPIDLPPLRDRLEDVPLLATHFLAAIGEQEGRARRFGAGALAQLASYSWPGNVRELRNVVQRAYVMAEGDVIEECWLPAAGRSPADVLEAGLARQARALGLPLPADEPAAAMPRSTEPPPVVPPAADAAGAGTPELASESAACIRLPLGISLADAERALVLATLRHFGHHKERTAATLGISLKTLYNRLKEYTAEEVAGSDASDARSTAE